MGGASLQEAVMQRFVSGRYNSFLVMWESCDCVQDMTEEKMAEKKEKQSDFIMK